MHLCQSVYLYVYLYIRSACLSVCLPFCLPARLCFGSDSEIVRLDRFGSTFRVGLGSQPGRQHTKPHRECTKGKHPAGSVRYGKGLFTTLYDTQNNVMPYVRKADVKCSAYSRSVTRSKTNWVRLK